MWTRNITFVTMLTLGASVGSGAAAQASPTEKTFEYVIQPGDTCAGIAERLFGNKRRWDVIHKHNPGMGPTPHRLVPGNVLIMPTLDQGPDAELTDVRRTVQARAPKDPTWERANKGKELYRGWRVNTLERASADVTFEDGSLVQMRQNTLIIIYGGVYRDARRKTTEASLERGTLRSRLSEFRLDVKTPTAEAGLEGGSSVVSVEDDGTSLLSNHEGGEAQFKVAMGQAVSVKPGFGSKARKGDRRPSKPRPLPPTPVWLADVATMFTGIRSEGGSVRGAWAPVQNAASYRIEIAEGREGGEVVVATKVPSTVTSFEIHRLPEGSYFARVSAIDEGKFESPQSEPHALHVHLVGLEEPGEAPAGEAGPDTAKAAEAAPAPARVLSGTKVVSPSGFVCGTGDQEKSASFVLTKGGQYELRCVGDDGTEAPKVAVTVLEPTLKLVRPDSAPSFIRAAEPQSISVSVESELPLPEGSRFRVPDGIVLEDVSTIGDTTSMKLSATKDSPDELALELVTGPEGDETVLAATRFDVIDSERLDFAPNEALGLTLSPNMLGLTNDRREGSGPFATVAYMGDPKSDKGTWRLSLGGEIAPIRRVRLGVALPVDVYRSSALPPPAPGKEGILLWGGYRILMRRDISLYAELGVWFPTAQEDKSIRRTRFAPAVEASYLLVDRLLFRTRQGAILETSSAGPFLWASAYGLDIKLVQRLAIGAEMDVTIGRVEGIGAIRGVGGGPGLSVLLGPAAIYFATRFNNHDLERTSGKFTFTGGVRLTFE